MIMIGGSWHRCGRHLVLSYNALARRALRPAATQLPRLHFTRKHHRCYLRRLEDQLPSQPPWTHIAVSIRIEGGGRDVFLYTSWGFHRDDRGSTLGSAMMSTHSVSPVLNLNLRLIGVFNRPFWHVPSSSQEWQSSYFEVVYNVNNSALETNNTMGQHKFYCVPI